MKRLLRIASCLAVTMVPIAALAAGSTEGPASWDMTPAQLREAGLGQSRGQPLLLEDGGDPVYAPEDPTVLFLNFDGAELVAGSDDSRIDRTGISILEGEFAPYGNGSKRDAVIQAVKEDWRAYNVIITDRRPETGNYVMNMVGPTDAYPSSTLGIAPLDCGNARTPNNITFAFHSINDSHSATATATTISQEIAHSFGLEHVDESSDIMNPFNAGGDPGFTDDCLPLVEGAKCLMQHEDNCPDEPLHQNAHRELYDLVGAKGPGGPGPDVLLLEPGDGDHFDLGEEIRIEVGAEEGLVIEQAALFVNGRLTDTDEQAPFGWVTNDVGEGEYEIYVEAIDTTGVLHASASVQVSVSAETSPQTDPGALPDSFGRGPAAQPACSVAAHPRPAALGLLAWLLVPGLLARRRARPST